jgi:hypothetical protein
LNGEVVDIDDATSTTTDPTQDAQSKDTSDQLPPSRLRETHTINNTLSLTAAN